MNVQINRDFFRSLFYFNAEENSALQNALEDKLLYDNNVTTWYDKIHFFFCHFQSQIKRNTELNKQTLENIDSITISSLIELSCSDKFVKKDKWIICRLILRNIKQNRKDTTLHFLELKFLLKPKKKNLQYCNIKLRTHLFEKLIEF